ncbi:MAG: hypothetical protein Q7R92_05315 [bacterium]|nr:hypothetical protein [bacterium]
MLNEELNFEKNDLKILKGYYGRQFGVVCVVRQAIVGKAKLKGNLKIPIEKIPDYGRPDKEEVESLKNNRSRIIFWIMKALEVESLLDALVGRENRPGRPKEVEQILAAIRTDPA